MADESNDRAVLIRRSAREVALDICIGRSVDRIAATFEKALFLVDGRPDVATGERDERGRDLEALTQERDAALADRMRATVSVATHLDALDAEKRLHALTMQRLQQATGELERTRALVDELRAELAAPTVQSAAVKAWLAWGEGARCGVSSSVRKLGTTAAKDAADVLDSLSMAPAAGATGKAERTDGEWIERDAMIDLQRDVIRGLRSELQQRPAVDPAKVTAWRTSNAHRRAMVLQWLMADPSREFAADAAAAALLESLS